MVRRMLRAWLSAHRGFWILGAIGSAIGYEVWAITNIHVEWRPYEWMLSWLVVPVWIFGLAFSAALELARPIHADPQAERRLAIALHALLAFPVTIAFAIVALVFVAVLSAGFPVDTGPDIMGALLAFLLIGPPTVGMLAAGWCVLQRRGTRAERVWFVALFFVGANLIGVLSQARVDWISGEAGTTGLPFIWAAIGLALYRTWRAPARPPDEATIELGDPSRPSFERARL